MCETNTISTLKSLIMKELNVRDIWLISLLTTGALNFDKLICFFLTIQSVDGIMVHLLTSAFYKTQNDWAR